MENRTKKVSIVYSSDATTLEAEMNAKIEAIGPEDVISVQVSFDVHGREIGMIFYNSDE